METLTLTRPDDWHLHLRDGAGMRAVVGHSARQFGRAIVMPNLKPPVTTVAQAAGYRARILEALPAATQFSPLMTLYLTPTTSVREIEKAADSDIVAGIKLYPAGATTNSAAGISKIDALSTIFSKMADLGLPLLIHGESTDPSVDIFDRETIFLEETLRELIQIYPRLKIVLEHITTARAVKFVQESPNTVAATITAHHLLLNRNALFQGGIVPHNYCLPILKRESDREALLAAATSGNAKFFLGTDSAPHRLDRKENACGCAGIYTAHAAIELYAEAFDQIGALDRLEGFASHFGADFYGLPRNTSTITIRRQPHPVPPYYPFEPDATPPHSGGVIPMRAGEDVLWTLHSPTQP